MDAIHLYTSNPADQALVGFAQALGHNLGREVQLRPLAQLPAPDPRRLPQLRLERAHVREDLAGAELGLGHLCFVDKAATAAQAETLFARTQALRSRLAVLDAALGAEKGGPRNG